MEIVCSIRNDFNTLFIDNSFRITIVLAAVKVSYGGNSNLFTKHLGVCYEFFLVLPLFFVFLVVWTLQEDPLTCCVLDLET